MEELIIRITDISEDVEILRHDHLLDKTLEKKMSLKAFVTELTSIANRTSDELEPKILPSGCIGYNCSGKKEIYVFNQPEHKRFITYSTGKINKAYKINYPSSIFVVVVNNNRFVRITQYMYVEYKGMETDLYYPAMPNTTHNMCLGNVRTEIDNGDVLGSLEKIIYSPYSHSTVDNIKSFRNTEDYFNYLTTHSIEPKYLKKYDGKLKDLFAGGVR